MKITYDEQADALNVSIRPGTVAQTLEIAPEVLVDIDEEGRTLNLEIIGAREKVGAENFASVEVGNRTVPLEALP